MHANDAQAVSASHSEDDFVTRIAAGDRAAENDFVRRYARGVSVLVRRHCRPGDPVVDDLTQDVLTRVLARLRAGAIRDLAALPAYIQTTIAHATSAEYRARRASEPIEAIEQLAGEGSPPEQLGAERLRATLHNLLAQLPVERDRELLRRFYLDEHSKEDVCRHLGIEPAHFHRVVFRARERFRTLLEQSGISEASR